MNRSNELAKNTFIIFLGRFCTQFVSFLLVPIYTNFLITSDYGYVDLIQTYVALLTPIIILRFDSAIFRFLIDFRKKDKDEEKTKIISSSVFLLLCLMIIFITVFFIINYFVKLNYWLAIILNIVFISISSYLLQLTRGIGKNLDYSIASIISGIITITVNLLLIIKLKYNASSILFASALANAICSLYLILKNRIYKYIKIDFFDKPKLKEMLKYSLPMIPDGLSWWIVNVSDRTIISTLIDTSTNGIYAVSSKFSNILSSIFQIFNMSWQESASLHINDPDKDEFFTEISNKTYMIFYSICIMIMAVIPFVFYFFIGEDYLSAYYYIPILLLGNLFNAIANVFGGVYIAKKLTKKVARTTMLAAVINITINLLLIKKFGLYAAAISTLVSYIVVAVYRFIDSKKYVNIKWDYKKFCVSMIFLIICTVLYYYNNIIINIINLLMITIVVISCNVGYIKMILQKINKILKGIKRRKD